MNTRRRPVFAALALALATGLPSLALAESYPSRPITLVIGYPPGGSTDLTGRVVGEELARALKATVVIENQAGVGGGIAAQRVAGAAPDGYTLMMASNNELVINQYVNRQVKTDGQRDFTPIGLVASQPMVLVATQKAGVRTLSDFVEKAKQNPGKFSYGSAGVGTALHLLGELVKDKGKLEIEHVPYKGAAPMTTDLLGNNIEYGVFVLSSGLPHIQSGKVIPLGTSEARRSQLLPEVPALGEHPSLKGVDVGTWFMLVGPHSLPADVTQKLRAALSQALKEPAVRKKLEASGSTVINSQTHLQAYLKDEATKYRSLVELAGVKP
jgi:tripartite-type tricarboxylate transporter receptor subunit TctC